MTILAKIIEIFQQKILSVLGQPNIQKQEYLVALTIKTI